MKEQRISFETAKLAREKGFMWKHVTFRKMTPAELSDPENERVVRMGVKDAPVWEGDVEPDRNGAACYNDEGKEIWPNKYSPRNRHYPRPTQDLLNKWLREQHKIYLQVILIAQYHPEEGWGYELTYTKDGSISNTDETESYSTYEEAMKAGLLEALKLIKNA